MTFDSNRAWKDAAAAVSANREVLFALAGVFYLLPSLAFALLAPQPEPAAGATQEQAAAAMGAFYASALPWIVPLAIFQAVGTLALLALLSDRRRPTVAEAIRDGAVGLLPYLAAQLLIGVAFGLVGGLLLAAAAAAGTGAVTAVVVVMLMAAVVYVLVKTCLVSPVVIVEGVRNPVAAIARSWRLTRGNSLRIALFFALLLIAFLVVMVVVGTVFGLLAALIASAEAAKAINAVVSSTLGSVIMLYLVAVIAAIHRQLAGPSAEALGATFE